MSITRVPSASPQERENVRGPFGGLFERGPVAAVVEEDEVRIGDVVEDHDRHVERRHPVVAAGDLSCRLCRGLTAVPPDARYAPPISVLLFVKAVREAEKHRRHR